MRAKNARPAAPPPRRLLPAGGEAFAEGTFVAAPGRAAVLASLGLRLRRGRAEPARRGRERPPGPARGCEVRPDRPDPVPQAAARGPLDGAVAERAGRVRLRAQRGAGGRDACPSSNPRASPPRGGCVREHAGRPGVPARCGSPWRRGPAPVPGRPPPPGRGPPSRRRKPRPTACRSCTGRVPPPGRRRAKHVLVDPRTLAVVIIDWQSARCREHVPERLREKALATLHASFGRRPGSARPSACGCCGRTAGVLASRPASAAGVRRDGYATGEIGRPHISVASAADGSRSPRPTSPRGGRSSAALPLHGALDPRPAAGGRPAGPGTAARVAGGRGGVRRPGRRGGVAAAGRTARRSTRPSPPTAAPPRPRARRRPRRLARPRPLLRPARPTAGGASAASRGARRRRPSPASCSTSAVRRARPAAVGLRPEAHRPPAAPRAFACTSRRAGCRSTAGIRRSRRRPPRRRRSKGPGCCVRQLHDAGCRLGRLAPPSRSST